MKEMHLMNLKVSYHHMYSNCNYFVLLYFILFYFRVLSVWLSGVRNCTLTQQPLDSTLSRYLVREYRDMRMSFRRREGEFNKLQLLYMYLDHSVLLSLLCIKFYVNQRLVSANKELGLLCSIEATLITS